VALNPQPVNRADASMKMSIAAGARKILLRAARGRNFDGAGVSYFSNRSRRIPIP